MSSSSLRAILPRQCTGWRTNHDPPGRSKSRPVRTLRNGDASHGRWREGPELKRVPGDVNQRTAHGLIRRPEALPTLTREPRAGEGGPARPKPAVAPPWPLGSPAHNVRALAPHDDGIDSNERYA